MTRVKLTYIAKNSDWNADNILHIGTDGRTSDLAGWMALANGNVVSSRDAQTQIVARGVISARLC